MDLFEFQAKEILSRYGISIPVGQVANSLEAAAKATSEIEAERYVVKAQLLAGGRGRAGAVQIVDNANEVKRWSKKFLGHKFVTDQTGPNGQTVRKVYIEEAISSYKPIFCAVLTDRSTGQPTLLGAPKGGDDITRQLATAPAMIERLPIVHGADLSSHDFVDFARRLKLEPHMHKSAAALFENMVRAFLDLDLTLIEINPLAITSDDQLIALDAKISVDDNALFRQKEFAELKQLNDLDPVELKAQTHDINFVRLSGDIGLIVNGAGLALATHDMLIDAGGNPANFMDIRTSATSTQIARGMDLVFDDPGVKVVLVNIHGGGLTRCDTVADAIGISRRRTGSQTPIIFRAAGTNADFAHKALKNYGVPYVNCKTMTEAISQAVALVKKVAA